MAALLCLMMLTAGIAAPAEESGEPEEIVESVLLDDDNQEIPETLPGTEGEKAENPARTDLIDRIIALGKKLYDDAGGKRKRAHYASDIYVCKNFTVYLFRQNRDDFRMAEYPETTLVIPNNLPAKKC